RQREIGVRLALGGARSRLVRQLLTESLMLALPAAALGFGVSEAGLAFVQRLIFATLPPLVGPHDPISFTPSELHSLRLHFGRRPGHYSSVRPGSRRAGHPA